MSDQLERLARQRWQACYPGRPVEDWDKLRPESRQAWVNLVRGERP